MIAETKPKLSRSQWGIIFLLAAVNFTHITDFVIIMPLSEQLMRELAISPEQFTHIVSVYGLAATVAVLASAAFIDRFDRRTVLLTAYAGFAISTFFCGLADSYAQLLIARGMAGACGGLAASAMMAIIGDIFADNRRGTAIGAVSSAFAVASVVGLPMGLFLAMHIARGAPFLLLAAASVPVWVAVFWKLPSLTAHRVARHLSPWIELYQAAKNPAHLKSFVFMFSLVMGTFTIIPFLAPYLELNCGQSKENIVVMYACAGCITFVSMNLIGRLTDRIGKRPVFLTIAVGCIAMTLTLTNLPVVSLLGAILAAAGFMVSASGRFIPAQAMMLGTAEPRMRGRFTNINTAMQHFATGMAPWLAGKVVTQADKHAPLEGYATAGYIAAGFALLSILISFTVHPNAASVPIPIHEPEMELEKVPAHA